MAVAEEPPCSVDGGIRYLLKEDALGRSGVDRLPPGVPAVTVHDKRDHVVILLG